MATWGSARTHSCIFFNLVAHSEGPDTLYMYLMLRETSVTIFMHERMKDWCQLPTHREDRNIPSLCDEVDC